MHNSKLIKLLQSLEKEELNEFARFCAFKDEKLESYQTKLIQLICKIAPDWESKHLFPIRAFQAIYGKKPFNEGKLKDVMTKSIGLFYEYLAYRNLDKNKTSMHRHLLAELNSRNLSKNFEQLHNKIDLDESPLRDTNYYKLQLELADEKDIHFQRKNIHEQNNSLEEKLSYLDAYYLAQKLKDYCKVLNWKIIIQIDYEVKLIDDILQLIEREKELYFQNPSIVVYYTIIQLLQADDKEEVRLEHLMSYLEIYREMFEEKELKEIYTMASNFCIQMINKGHQEYLNRQFDIYRQMLEQGLFYDEHYLSQWKYMNMVTLGIRCNALDWTQDFIENHVNGIKEEARQNAYTYNRANYLYAIKDYDGAHELLNDVEFSESAYVPVSKSLLLKIYFETDETEALPYHIEAFRKFIQRNKLMSDYNKTIYKNLLKYTEKLFQLIHYTFPTLRKPEQQAELAKLKSEILETKNIANIGWLVDMIELREG